MPKVFISHSWEDKVVALRLAEKLKRDDAEIWIDYAGITGGDSLPDRISEALDWCDTLILVWSASAKDSKWVKKEWGVALSMGKQIIPCIMDNTVLPPILQDLIFIPLQSFDKGCKQLVHALKQKVHHNSPPSPYNPAAADSLAEEPTENKQVRKIKETPSPVGRKVNRWKTLPLRKILISAVVIVGLGCAYWIGDRYIIHLAKVADYNPEGPYVLRPFRSVPKELSDDEVKYMLQSKYYYDCNWNSAGEGYNNDYERQAINGDKVVVDRASELMWQQGGSNEYMTKSASDAWINSLNEKGFAGHKGWRLPTLEEAMSLIEPKKNGDLYIDSLFDKTQRWIWTSDKVKDKQWAWIVGFYDGFCYYGYLGLSCVRAVCFQQSDEIIGRAENNLPVQNGHQNVQTGHENVQTGYENVISNVPDSKAAESTKNREEFLLKANPTLQKGELSTDLSEDKNQGNPKSGAIPSQVSFDEMKVMLKHRDFYDEVYNKTGKGYVNDFELKTINEDKIVIDRASGLMWQQGGASGDMTFKKAEEWLNSLNAKSYAGYNDWRLPTLDEAMSLVESQKNNENLYIDPVFDRTQGSIWTSNMDQSQLAWIVLFLYGSCDRSTIHEFNVLYVRAVRPLELSDERSALTATTEKPPLFRSSPLTLSKADVKTMLDRRDFYCRTYEWSKEYSHPEGKGFANDYDLKTIQEDKVVIDRASGLMWQQGGSAEYMTKEKADAWINSLNAEGYAGFNDWRLPTLEEAMSLMEPKQSGDLYIDPLFDKTQRWIWTGDKVEGGPWAWVVSFSFGNCYDGFYLSYGLNYVRAVRIR